MGDLVAHLNDARVEPVETGEKSLELLALRGFAANESLDLIADGGDLCAHRIELGLSGLL